MRRLSGNSALEIFSSDLLKPHPHDVDVKALRRIAVAYNIPIACSRANAGVLLWSLLMERAYERTSSHLNLR